MGREIAGVMGWQSASWLEREECQQEERGDLQNVNLPDASIDLAIMINVYHELEFPFDVIDSLVRALKPGGRIAYVEYQLEDQRVPIKAQHK